MKKTRLAATYAKENSCVEDILEIANAVARENHPMGCFDSRNREAIQQRAKRQNAVH